MSINQKNTLYLFVILCVFLLRYPYLDQLFLSEDENLYLIIGRDLLDGAIPNVDNYSNKSPLLSFFYTIPSFFENVMFTTRIYTYFLILTSSFLLIKLLKKNQSYKEILFFILIFVILINQHQGKALIPQILALPFILLIYIFCLNEKINHINIFFCGTCSAILFLIHPSGIFLAISIFTFLKFSQNIYFNLKIIIFFISGYLFPFILLTFFYLIKNNLEIFPLFESIFIIPYKWSILLNENQNIFFKTFYVNIITSRFLILYIFIFVCLLINVTNITKTLNKKLIFLFLITLLGVFLMKKNSIVYYIILIPGIILIISECLAGYKNKLKFLYIVIFLSPALIYQLNDFQNIYSKNLDKLIDNDIKKISKEIKKISVKNDEMLILDNHILYLILNKKIPSKFKYHTYFEDNDKAAKKRMVFNETSFINELETLMINKKIKYLVVNKKKLKYLNKNKFDKYFESKEIILDRTIFKIK